MRIRLLPYKIGSSSAKLLADALGCKRLYAEGSAFIQRRDDVVINWGCSATDNVSIIPSLNKFSAIKTACNKLQSMIAFKNAGVSCPDFIDQFNPDMPCQLVRDWINSGHKVYCRTQLSGHGGNDIIIASTLDEVVEAPLYTCGVRADKEYRVHVFRGEVIDYVKKGRSRDSDEDNRPSHLIRNYSQGWVFIRENIELPEVVIQESLKAVEALGLDFGAVDIATVKGTNNTKAVVYEVNTACGIQGTTLTSYVSAIRRWLNAII